MPFLAEFWPSIDVPFVRLPDGPNCSCSQDLSWPISQPSCRHVQLLQPGGQPPFSTMQELTQIHSCNPDIAWNNTDTMSKTSTRRELLSKIAKPEARVRKSERTREAILGAAVDFLWTHPFRELTVGELMSRAGSSRPAFYQYFTDLHELMETLLTGLKQDIFEAATSWFQGEGDPLPHLQESLAGLVRVCYERGPILRAVSDAAANDPRLEKAWYELLNDFDVAVATRIEQHQAAGFTPELDARMTAMALNRMDASMLIEAFGRRPRAQQQPVLDALLHIWSSTLYSSTRRFRGDREDC